MEKKLYRDELHKKIGGVCAGLADYFNVDVTIIRVLFLATLILKGGGVIIYIILWAVLPVKNYIFTDPNVDYRVPPNPFGSTGTPGDPFTGKIPGHRSSGTIVAGTILILLGVFFLLDQLNIIPDWDFENIWPVVLILIGAAFMVSSGKKQPWDHDNWQHTTGTGKKDDTLNDNPPIV